MNKIERYILKGHFHTNDNWTIPKYYNKIENGFLRQWFCGDWPSAGSRFQGSASLNLNGYSEDSEKWPNGVKKSGFTIRPDISNGIIIYLYGKSDGTAWAYDMVVGAKITHNGVKDTLIMQHAVGSYDDLRYSSEPITLTQWYEGESYYWHSDAIYIKNKLVKAIVHDIVHETRSLTVDRIFSFFVRSKGCARWSKWEVKNADSKTPLFGERVRVDGSGKEVSVINTCSKVL